MLTKTAIDRLAGVLLIALGVALFVSLATDIGVDPTRLEFRDSLEDVLEERAQYLTSRAFELVSSILWIATAGTLYTVFQYHDKTLALLGTFLFLVVGVAFLIGAWAGFALVDLAEEFAEPHDAEASAVFTSARAVAFIANTSITGLFVVFPFGLLSLRCSYQPDQSCGSLVRLAGASRGCPASVGRRVQDWRVLGRLRYVRNLGLRLHRTPGRDGVACFNGRLDALERYQGG